MTPRAHKGPAAAMLVAAALVSAVASPKRPALAANSSAPSGAAPPVPADCARFLPPPTVDGRAAFRDLPLVSPAAQGPGRTLGLDIHAQGPSSGRFAGGVAVGELSVRGVPGFAVTPRPGARVQARDPATGALADMAPACLSSPAFAYGGMVWALDPGDDLQMHVTSALDYKRGEVPTPAAGGVSCRGANVHTHGVMVSPYKRRQTDGATLYGDYVFDVAAPPGEGDADPCAPPSAKHPAMSMADAGTIVMHAAAGGEMRIDSQLAGAPGAGPRGPTGQPSGLFWYHPHPHGYAALLTAGATSGAISIGSVGDYACVRVPSGGCASAAPRVRYLLLKDAELAPESGGWKLEPARDYDLEDACTGGDRDKAAEREGECADWRGRRWLFTVNGVRDPVIADVQPGRSEVWRIVNGSPNVTYRLSLRPLGDDDPAKALPLAVLSDEGAAPEARGWIAPGSARQLLLMPGARVEVAVSPPSAGGVYGLQQDGFASFGDLWPAVRLAEVRFAPGPAAAPLSLHGRPTLAAEPADRFVETGAAPGCGFGAQDVRHIYFVQRPTYADDRRRTGLYGLLAAVQSGSGAATMTDGSGQPVVLSPESWRALLSGDALAPAAMHNPFGGVCTYLGHTETWVIENDTDEDHNFHIHQAEFQLALDRANDPQAFSAPPQAGRDKLLAASDAAVAAADGRGRVAQEAVLYHDTIPVPRGTSLGGRGCDGSPMNPRCRPGRVTIRVRFDRDEQVGTFVYHCHILQHEDNGMMATVRVLCPPDDKACLARHAGG